MIRYLGHWELYSVKNHPQSRHSDSIPESPVDKEEFSYNILLEYSAFDLQTVFCQRLPPALPTEIEKFWKAVCPLADAVDKLHNLTLMGGNGNPVQYHG